MDLDECVQAMSGWFISDTIELFDLVLADGAEDPQYSAITTLNRLWLYLQYQKASGGDLAEVSVPVYLEKIGYTADDIALFRKKAQEERKIYHGQILNADFFDQEIG